MAELTKEEQIQAIYDLKVGYTLGHADIAMLKAMARQLLASMEQAPVYLRPFGDDGETFVACDGNDERAIPLYAAPQLPQPAVVPEVTADDCPAFIKYDVTDVAEAWARGYNACRAAMLQGADGEPTDDERITAIEGIIPVADLSEATVQGWIPCSERMPEFDTSVLLYFPDYGGHIESGCIGDEGDGPYHYFFDGDSLRHEPTHWMPLPAEPQQEVTTDNTTQQFESLGFIVTSDERKMEIPHCSKHPETELQVHPFEQLLSYPPQPAMYCPLCKPSVAEWVALDNKLRAR